MKYDIHGDLLYSDQKFQTKKMIPKKFTIDYKEGTNWQFFTQQEKNNHIIEKPMPTSLRLEY